MRALVSILAAGWLTLAAAAQTGETPAPMLVQRVLAAHGGAANIAKFRAATWKGTGHFAWVGPGNDYTVIGARQGADEALMTVESDVNGQANRLVRVLNHDRGWLMLNEHVQDLDPVSLAEEKERTFANWLATLVPLIDGRLPATLVADVDVAGRKAFGLRFRSPGQRDVTLYFDRETCLLVKKDMRVQDMTRNGQVTLQETFYTDYALFEGARIARKLQVKWDGKVYLEMTITEIRPQESLPEMVFFRPQPSNPPGGANQP